MARHMSSGAAFAAWQRQDERRQDEMEQREHATKTAASVALYVVAVRRQGRMRWVRPDGSTTPVRSDAAALSAARATETSQRVHGEMERV